MQTASGRRLGAILLLAGLCAAGCHRGTPSLAQVRGTVSYRGSPLRGGVVVFTPDASQGASGPLAHAEIQPDGSYVLHTGEAAGAVPGWHRVTVVAVQAAPPPAPGERFAVLHSAVPEKYRDPDLSGLTREVKAGEANVIDLDLP
jgi:hypothetical protein